MLRVLDTDLQDFRWYQALGLLGKPHHAVGVHQDLDGPWGHAPALQHLQEKEIHQGIPSGHACRVSFSPTSTEVLMADICMTSFENEVLLLNSVFIFTCLFNFKDFFKI